MPLDIAYFWNCFTKKYSKKMNNCKLLSSKDQIKVCLKNELTKKY